MNIERADQITIATSISPGNIEAQQKTIATWTELGFRTLSLNIPEEITHLNDFFPKVTFVSVDRHAATLAGKPLVYLDDMLLALQESASSICGIVNSDIYFSTDKEFLQFIAVTAENGFVFGSRHEVASFFSEDSVEYGAGFDYFFFDKKLASLYPQSRFALGAPWWDYWFPLVPILKGAAVKLLVSPVAYHVKHDTNWSKTLYEEMSLEFFNLLTSSDLLEKANPDIRAAVERANKQPDLGALSLFILYYLKDKADKIAFLRKADAGKSAEISLHEKQNLLDFLSFYQAQFEQMLELIMDRETDRVNLIEMINCLEKQIIK